MLEQPEQYSITKHCTKENVTAHFQHELKIQCPLKYCTPENGIDCVQEKCAWFMILQHACAINVQARIIY
jgi:hypothetical protein